MNNLTPQQREKVLVNSKEYGNIHKWISYHYGKADKCESSTCKGVSKNYQWALLKGKEYHKDVSHFWQLCCSCHTKYDENVNKGELMRKLLTGKKHTQEHNDSIGRGHRGLKYNFPNGNKQSKKLRQLSIDGEFIREWKSLAEAVEVLGVHGGNVSSVCNGNRNKTAGFKWEYIN